MSRKITPETLRARLNYNPDTGIFTWLPKANSTGENRRWNKRFSGKVAGSLDTRGHLQINLGGCLYAAHRLAWLYIYGTWPAADLDHRDRIKTHNWIGNLRPATRSQNCSNTPLRKDSTSGVKGVSWNSQKQKWTAYVVVSGRQVHLGSFAEKDAAIAARQAAARKCYGEFFSDLTEAVAA